MKIKIRNFSSDNVIWGLSSGKAGVIKEKLQQNCINSKIEYYQNHGTTGRDVVVEANETELDKVISILEKDLHVRKSAINNVVYLETKYK